MLQNNLDPEVAERPEELIVYGGRGKAARNWPALLKIMEMPARPGERRDPAGAERQAGGRLPHPRRRAPRAARQLAAGARLGHARDRSSKLEAAGLTMYGQMTAGSWIYIGTQGILQGTYETFAQAARKHFGGSLAGRLVLTAGLGGMGGAQPLAVTMNGGVALCVEVDPTRIQRRLDTALPRHCRRQPGRRAARWPTTRSASAARSPSACWATPRRSIPRWCAGAACPTW